MPLYRRSGRGIEITDLGRRLAEESAEVFTGLAKLDSLVESVRTISRPRMRIAAFTSFDARLLPDIIEPVARAHPDLRFDIQLNEPAKIRRSHCTIEIRSAVPQDEEVHLPEMARTVLFDDDYAGLALVAANLAITVLPRLSTMQLPDGRIAVDLTDPVPSRRVVMHVREREAHLPHVRAFATAAEAVAADHFEHP